MSDPLIVGLLGLLLGGAVVGLFIGPRFTRLLAERARLEAELEAARRSVEEQRALLVQSQTQLRDAFAAVSQDALRENRQDFLQNADALLAPVRDTLNKVQAQLVDVDKAREGSFRAVASQLSVLSGAQEKLREAAEGLSRSLKSPNVRGKWGEIQLRRIVELAGMVSSCDFTEKPSVTGDDGSKQLPDMVVHLPGGGTIVIDSKVPIDAYLSAMEATTDQTREDRLAAHVRQVRDHVRALGGKEYWKQFPQAPQFVVMFLPLEALLATALEREATLLDQAAGLRVIPATPLTLLALLKAVALGWRQEQVARSAEELQSIGRELYERLATMVEHLERAGDSYDRLVGSLEQKVLPGARRFKDLGVNTTKEIESPEPVRLSPRAVTKSELLGQAAADPLADDEDRPDRIVN
jgi:DNA recombination protein RmuC